MGDVANYSELNQYSRNKSENSVVIYLFSIQREILLFNSTFICFQRTTLLGSNAFFKIWCSSSLARKDGWFAGCITVFEDLKSLIMFFWSGKIKFIWVSCVKQLGINFLSAGFSWQEMRPTEELNHAFYSSSSAIWRNWSFHTSVKQLLILDPFKFLPTSLVSPQVWLSAQSKWNRVRYWSACQT